jgi:hypothetical protein
VRGVHETGADVTSARAWDWIGAGRRRFPHGLCALQFISEFTQRFVRGLPRLALLPTAVRINKPKEMPRTESPEVVNSWTTEIEQKNGFHN